MGDKPKLTSKFYSSVLVGLAGSLCYGYNLTSVNTIHSFIKCWLYTNQNDLDYQSFCSNSTNVENQEYQNSIVEKWSLVASLTFGSCIISAFLGGALSDKIGRKKALELIYIIDAIGVILASTAYFSNSYAQLLIGRFMNGLGVGAYTVICPIYFNEILPKDKKNLVVIFTVAFNVGVIIAQILGIRHIFGTYRLWPIVTGFSLIFLVIGILASFLGVETPDWYILKNDVDAAKDTQMQLYLQSYKDDIAKIRSELDAEISFVQRMKQLWENKAVIKAGLFLSVVIMGCHNFSGFPVILIYSTNIFTIAGFSNDLAGYITIGLNFLNLLAGLFLGFLMKKIGRRVNLVTSLGLVGLMALIIAILGQLGNESQNQTMAIGQVVCTFMFMIAANAGCFPLPMLLASEYISFKYRASVQSLILLFAWLSAFIVVLVYPIIETAIGPLTFAIFAGVALVWSLWMWFRLIEPKGKQPSEIEAKFAKRKFFL